VVPPATAQAAAHDARRALHDPYGLSSFLLLAHETVILTVTLFSLDVHRDRVLKQTVQIFQVTPPVTLRRHLRVDFMDEPGIDGGGILREWLQLVCKELFAETLGLFKRTASSVDGGYWIHRTATRKSNSELQMYRFFGMFLAKALLEGLVVNVRLATPLLKHLLGSPLSREDLRFLDDQIYASVNYILANDHSDELSLTFSVADRELISNGAEIAVTDANKHKYVELLVQYYLFDSVEDELSAIHDGFRSVLPTTPLHAFDHKELDLVLSGLAEIDVLDWQAHTNVGMLGHDAAQEQQIVDWFWEIVDDFDQRKRSRLLQYVTGSSGVPVEGFAALTSLDGTLQPFTIQLVDIAAKTYSTLPYASTCFNRCVEIYQLNERYE
jgi:E3 ubiquitin ligase SMURF1/2